MIDENNLGSYVYVLTNAAMPGLVKIGRTDAADPDERARQLYTTGVPVPFDVEYAGQVADPAKVESALHTAFQDHRVNPKREFFRIKPEQVIAILELFDAEDVTSSAAADLNSTVSNQERSAGERLKKRRPPLNFVEMGIPIGSELVCVRDNERTATVVEPKKVTFDDEVVAISHATMIILDASSYVAPQKHWTFEGRLLEDIYDETYPPTDD